MTSGYVDINDMKKKRKIQLKEYTNHCSSKYPDTYQLLHEYIQMNQTPFV